MRTKFTILIISITLFASGLKAQKFELNRESLSRWEVPEWFDNAVPGFYSHWSVYSVPGFRFNDGPEMVDIGLWYGGFMYIPNGKGENYGVYDFHRKTYGDPMEFGYHDLVPIFTTEKWDPDYDKFNALFPIIGK